MSFDARSPLVLLDPASVRVMVEKVASTPAIPTLGMLDGAARFVAGVQG